MIADAWTADEAFLTGTGAEVVPIAQRRRPRAERARADHAPRARAVRGVAARARRRSPRCTASASAAVTSADAARRRCRRDLHRRGPRLPRRRAAHGEDAEHAGRRVGGRDRGDRARAGRRRRLGRRGRGLRPRHDRDDQRAARGARGAHRARRDRGLHRSRRARPPGPRRPLPAVRRPSAGAGRRRSCASRSTSARGPHGADPRPAGLPALAERLAAAEVEAIAVVLLHASAHPGHELAVRDALRRRLPGVHISVSHEVSATPREYERGATTELDAALSPLLRATPREPHRALRRARACPTPR